MIVSYQRSFRHPRTTLCLLALAALLVMLGALPGAARAQGVPVVDRKILTFANPVYTTAVTAHNQFVARPRWEAFRKFVLALSSGYDWRDLALASDRLGEPMASAQGLGWARPGLIAAVEEAFPGLAPAADWAERIRTRYERMLHTYRATLEGVRRQMQGFQQALAQIESYRGRAQSAEAVGAAMDQLRGQVRLFLAEEWLLLRQQLMTQSLMGNLDLARRTNSRAEAHAALRRALGIVGPTFPPPEPTPLPGPSTPLP